MKIKTTVNPVCLAMLAAALPHLAAGTGPGLPAGPDIQGEELAVLTQAPNVPPPITRKHAAKVIVHLEVKEITKRLADGVAYAFWTFGGNVPGSFIRIREGDLVEFHLHNNQNNKLPHNIDLHAVTGPGGGAAASFTAPGHSSQFSFTALNPGIYVYHCATAPVGMHVANGMYGLILVEPKQGLPPVNREYYIMQGEFYTAGKYGEEGLQPFDQDKAVDERPPYVVFNGAVGALAGTQALTARVGEKVRLYVGNGGPNLSSSFHVIGLVFDTVYQEGGNAPTHNVQTTIVPPGGATIVEFTTKTAGNYALVDHSLFRAFNKGAVGTLAVSGPENLAVFSGKQADTAFTGKPIADQISPELAAAMAKPATRAESTPIPAHLDPSLHPTYQRGREVYRQTCFVCHQPNGQGVAEQIPPLAKSDVLMEDKLGAIRGVLQGRSGELIVNGKKYNGIMVAMPHLTDQQIADVITYVRNSWGNAGDAATTNEVQELRKTAPVLAANPFE